MQSFDRLKEERERLRLTQQQLADIAGIHRNAQSNYEKGERKPDLAYFEKLAEAGVDVLYIITGRKDNLSSDQLDLIKLFDQASLENKLLAVQALKGQLQSAVVQTNTGEHQVITGSGQIINQK